MASYASKVKADIARWSAAGLIDAATAGALSREIDLHQRRSISFGNILATFAAVLVGAAILVFIAAQWESIPRLARVAMLGGLILAGYVGGAVLKLRDHGFIAEAVWLVATAAFGGSIALIGQMYHMAGDESGAVLVWFFGALAAAAALRSGPLTAASAALAAAWLFLRLNIWDWNDVPHLFLLLAALVWAVSYWTQSRPARHLVLLSLVFYALMLAIDGRVMPTATALAAISAVLLAASVFAPRETDRIVQLDGALPLHALIGFLAGMFMVQAEVSDDVPSFLLAAVLTLAVIVGSVVLAGRESRGLRWIAYAGFTVEVCFIYVITMGTMLGTAGMFLASGLVLAVAALLITRIERRINEPVVEAGAA